MDNLVKEAALQEIMTLYEIMGDERFGIAVAKFVRNTFKALVKEGFTEPQALSIVTKLQLK